MKLLNVETRCDICKRGEVIPVPAAGYRAWRAGRERGGPGPHLQDALAEVHAAQREQLLTGLCPVCWEDLFAPEEDEEPTYARRVREESGQEALDLVNDLLDDDPDLAF